MEHKILLVHDDPSLLARMIEKLRPPGYRILLAFDNNQAWETIAREQPDMVILDERFPQYKSLEMLQQLRSNAETSSILIILITCRPANEAFFVKPVKIDVVLAWPPDNQTNNYAELLSFVKWLFRRRDEDKI